METKEFKMKDENEIFERRSFMDKRGFEVTTLTPIGEDGKSPADTEVIINGGATVVLQTGMPQEPTMPMRLEFHFPEDKVRTVREAFEVFEEYLKLAFEERMAEMQRRRMEQQSSIIVPGQGNVNANGNVMDFNPNFMGGR